MRYLYTLIVVLSFSFSGLAQNGLHSWYESANMGVRFNPDRSKVLIVAHDRVTLWSTADGSLIKSMPMAKFNGASIEHKDFDFIDASPNLDEFLYQVRGTYQRFMLDIEDIDLFPNFQNREVKKILGYDEDGYMVFYSEGEYQGFFRVLQIENASLVQPISKEFVSNSEMSNDRKYIIFTRDNTFRYVNIKTKEVTNTKLPPASWRTQHLPLGEITYYKWDRTKKKGKEVVWRYFIKLGEPLGKKLIGKNAQSNFRQKDFCSNYPNYVYVNDDNTHWVIYNSDNDYIGGKKVYRYNLVLENGTDCKEIRRISFTETRKDFDLKKGKTEQQQKQQYQQEQAKKEAMQPAWFQEYITKFPQLPSTFTFDYENMAGVDVTNLPFVQNELYRIGNPSDYAIGKIMTCPNGTTAVLRMSREIKGHIDTSKFYIITYDKNGKQLDLKRIGDTQKSKGQFALITFFTIKSTSNGWTVSAESKSTMGGKPSNGTFNGGCM